MELSQEAVIGKLSELGVEVEYRDDGSIFAVVKRDKVRAIARSLYELGAYFMTCVGSDETQLRGYLSLYHIFGFDKLGLRVVLRVDVPRLHPSVPSIVAEVPAADWCELEARDMLGIDVVGRPVKRLVLPEDWPEGVHPLRKDFKYDTRPPKQLPQPEVGKEVGLPLGPYHPALHEPEYFEIYGRGEVVEDIVYRGFHVHRGIEKLAESERMTYEDIFYLAERICGICGFVHSSCYAQAVEKAAGVEVPERAEYLRSLLLEVERIHSHLLWLGVVAHILGYDAGFMHTWRIREKVMVVAEVLTGSRKTYGINTIGGLRFDIDRGRLAKALSSIKAVREGFTRFLGIFLSVPQIKSRASGTGVLSRSEARALSVVGPVARASGLYRDVRKDYPYFAYREVSFKVPLCTEGDNLARIMVRVEEVMESIEIIKQLVDKLPGGPVRGRPREIPPLRKVVAAVEAPRGEDVHFLITGIRRPYRWRVRAPTYQNIPALRAMLRGAPLADAPLTIASIDPCFSCTDRAVFCDRSSGTCRRIELRRLAGG